MRFLQDAGHNHQAVILRRFIRRVSTKPYPSFRGVCRTLRFPIQCGLFVLDEFNPVDQGGPACYDEVYCGLQYLR